MTTRLLLPGLIGSHPLAALASFGLLRLVDGWDPKAKLGFTQEDDWIAYLDTERFSTQEILIDALCRWVADKSLDDIFGWADDARTTPKIYQDLLDTAIDSDDLPMASWLSAIAAYGAADRQKGLIKPSAFYMVSGQQSFLGGARDILEAVRHSASALFVEALQGPWLYKTRLHSLGWDPNTERLHALRNRAPTSEKPSCIAAAVILGLAALPLYPTVSDLGRANTTGFAREGRDNYFCWPIFAVPIDLSELCSLLQTAAWTNDTKLRNGIAAVYRSRRSEFGQGYAVLRAAQVMSRPQQIRTHHA